MPNKIFSIKLDSFVNPKNIEKQIAKKSINKKNKNANATNSDGLISKSASNASKAYATSDITKNPTGIKMASLIKEVQEVKNEAQRIYSAPEYHKLYFEAKKDAQHVKEGKYGLLQAENKTFRTTEPKGSRPAYTIIAKYDLNTGNIISKSVVSENDARPTIITKYDGDNFEEVGFLSGHLYKYSKGKETADGWTIDCEYRYSLVDLGKVLESDKGIIHNKDGSSKIDVSYKYNDKGLCTVIERDIELNSAGKTVFVGDVQKFDTDGQFYVFKADSKDA